MEEKDKNIEQQQAEKLEWEAPKLISLDKGKTEGGVTYPVTNESTSYQDS